MRYSSSWALVIGLALLVGCAGEVSSPRPFESTKTNVDKKRSRTPTDGTDDDTSPSEGDPLPSDGVDPNDVEPPLPPGMPPPDTNWLGGLPSTDWVEFGGSGFCKYRARLVDVRVTVRLTATGRIATTFVTATAEEEGLDGCELETIAPNLHKYTYSPEAPTEGPFTTKNVSGNLPAVEMTGEVVITDPTKGTATLRWRRTDVGPPLDWKLTAQVPLVRT